MISQYQIKEAEARKKNIIEEAEQEVQSRLKAAAVDAKEQGLAVKTKVEKEVKIKWDELRDQERRIHQKEDELRLIELLKLIQNAKKNGFRTSHLGVIGSRAKWKAFEKSAIEAGIDEQIVLEVECPIGLNIGAESPQEIAIAVCASIISKIKEQNPDDENWREATK